MRQQIIAGAMALALATGMTTSAMAFDQDSGFHSRRFEGVRGFSGWRHGEWGSRRFVGGYGPRYDGDYGARRGLAGVGAGSYCPAFSRCGAGLPN
ncbi:MAG: hypothetical protein WBG16_06150 [Bradyrhizobium sp.]|jgi:hypothetical protein|uniref:hypothetical protein n=1 Tax=Bradyrhizobium sp. TaxID=376 RepID=UPI003C727198